MDFSEQDLRDILKKYKNKPKILKDLNKIVRALQEARLDAKHLQIRLDSAQQTFENLEGWVKFARSHQENGQTPKD